MANYLELSLATPAAHYFQRVRAADREHFESPNSGLSLRTFGVAELAQQDDDRPTLTRWLSDATPRLSDCARAQRLLLTVPNEEESGALINQIRDAYGLSVDVLNGCGNDANICCEMSELSLPHVLQSLTGDNRQYAETAARLHTRRDIAWLPLPGE